MSEKRETVSRVLSAVSGVPESEIHAIWREVQVNHQRLESCPGPHDFKPDVAGAKLAGSRLPRKERCSRCNGTLDVIHVDWYKRGLTHGSRR